MRQLIFCLFFLTTALSSKACICNDDSFFSLERFDRSVLVLDIKYSESLETGEVLRIYKGEVDNHVKINIGDCDLNDGAIYHFYFENWDGKTLNIEQATRCRQLFQTLEKFVEATNPEGDSGQQYNSFAVETKRNNQELVILRALKEQYLGKLKECLLITDSYSDVLEFEIIKGKFRKGKRVGKWTYYEFDNNVWVKKTKRY